MQNRDGRVGYHSVLKPPIPYGLFRDYTISNSSSILDGDGGPVADVMAHQPVALPQVNTGLRALKALAYEGDPGETVGELLVASGGDVQQPAEDDHEQKCCQEFHIYRTE